MHCSWKKKKVKNARVYVDILTLSIPYGHIGGSGDSVLAPNISSGEISDISSNDTYHIYLV